MIFTKEALEEILRTRKPAHFAWWAYDIVLERLERSGFRLAERTERGGTEAAFYRHPDHGLVKVVTSRFIGPVTVIEPDPSPEKPKGKG